MKIKKGDKVIVIAGNDKGKTGTVQKVHPKLNKVVVEGVAVRKKHKKPTQQNPEGSILEIYAPIDASNVSLIDPKTKKATRARIMTVEVKGKLVKGRYSRDGKSKLD
ncbi:MAG: 50S ribosomal protein L24 [Firmicutes bacterium]|nr:50S ribosomal protein L24 [Bacillota bacterium]